MNTFAAASSTLAPSFGADSSPVLAPKPSSGSPESAPSISPVTSASTRRQWRHLHQIWRQKTHRLQLPASSISPLTSASPRRQCLILLQIWRQKTHRLQVLLLLHRTMRMISTTKGRGGSLS